MYKRGKGKQETDRKLRVSAGDHTCTYYTVTTRWDFI